MASQAEKRRRKKARRSAGGVSTVSTPAKTQDAPSRPRTERPTPERKARGAWVKRSGPEKRYLPDLDAACDVIGALYVGRHITHAQEQAARAFQELRAAYLAELPDISGYKSCLDGGVPGYDDGDGNPEVIARYRSIEGKLELGQRRELLLVCDMGDRPTNIELLRAALDVVASC